MTTEEKSIWCENVSREIERKHFELQGLWQLRSRIINGTVKVDSEGKAIDS